MTLHTLRAAVTTVAIAATLSGCATTGSGTGSMGSDKCNPLAASLTGAFVGALAGATRDRNAAARGAVIGAAVGALACLAVNASSRQTRTADSVESAYRTSHGGRLPSAPQVLNYDTEIAPGAKVAAGQPIEVKSRFAIIDGSSKKLSSVREELVLLDNSGKEIKRVGKNVDASLGGEYENTFSFSFPKGVSQGIYGIRTELLVDGQVAGRNDDGIQLVFGMDGQPRQLAMR